MPEPVKEVRISRGPRDPRLSAGLTPLPRDRDDDSPIASTSGHIPLGVYHSNEEPLPYNHVEALKELVSHPLYSYLPYIQSYIRFPACSLSISLLCPCSDHVCIQS